MYVHHNAGRLDEANLDMLGLHETLDLLAIWVWEMLETRYTN